ncbi:hypothetical protein G9A89_000810 [Geosiphon pyriformis]|nr:hypothetical protein G9A89_000810 [Geosiphon pyriformis]
MEFLIVSSFFIIFVSTLFFLFSNQKRKTPNEAIPLPGPLALPIIGNILQVKKTLHETFLSWGNQYGPIFQVKFGAETFIVINDQEVAHDLFVNRGVNYSSRPRSRITSDLWFNNSKTVALAPYGNWWKTMRTFINTGLRQNVIDKVYQPILTNETKRFLTTVYKSTEGGQSFDPHLSIYLLFTNFFSIIVYGYYPADGEHDDPLLVKYKKIIEKSEMIFTLKAMLMDFFPWISYVPSMQNFRREILELKAELKIITTSLVLRVRQSMSEKATDDKDSCFVAQVLRNVTVDESIVTSAHNHEFKKNEKGLYTVDQVDLLSLCNVYMFGGSRNTIGTQRWIFAFLASYPEIQAHLHKELDEVIGRGKFYNLEQEPKLHYLKAIVKEVLRYRPIMPLNVPRKPIEDDVYRGYHIPARATIVLNTYSLNFNPSIHNDPEKFMPERYLDENGNLKESNEFLDPWGFGSGRRICPGEKLALRDLYVITGYTLALFTITADDDPKTGKPQKIDLNGQGSSFSFAPKPHKLKFIPREGINVAAALKIL